MFPSSPLPHITTPTPLIRSPTSLAARSQAAGHRRRDRLAPATSDDELPYLALDSHDDWSHSDAIHDDRAGASGITARGEVTMPVGVPHWRRGPKKEGGMKIAGGSALGSGTSGPRSGTATSTGIKSGRGSGMTLRMASGKSKGLGMGMRGTPARKGWSKSKSKTQIIGLHSTPIEVGRARSRSQSKASITSMHVPRDAAGAVAPTPSASSSLSSLPLTPNLSEVSFPESLDLPSSLGSPDVTIPTIPTRPPNKPHRSLRNTGPMREADDVFSASYPLLTINRRPGGPTREGSDDDWGDGDFDRLIHQAEEETPVPGRKHGSRRNTSGDAADSGESERDEEAIRDLMFPGMIDMLWPVISSSDIPSDERQVESADDTCATEAGASVSASHRSARAAGGAYTESEMPVKGTPYRVRVKGVADDTAKATNPSTDTPRTARALVKPMHNAAVRTSSSQTPVAQPRRPLLKSAMKGSPRISPIKAPRPQKSALRDMSLRSHTKSIGIPAEGTHPGGDTPASLVDRDGKSADDTNDDTNDDTTGHTADRTEIVWSFDQPLRGDTIDEQEQELIDTDVAETKGATVNGITQSMTPQRDRLTGSTSLKAIVRPGARKIAQRPKTPARLGIRTSAMDVTDEDGTDLSSPIRAQGAWFAAAANETTLDCGREGGSSIAMNRRRPLLRQTLSELLRSDDGSTLTETSIPSFPQPTSSASQGLLARTRNGGRLPANDNIDGHGEKCDEREGRSWFVDMTLSQLMRTSSETGQDVLPFSKDPVPPAKRSSVSDDPVSLRQFAKRTGVKAKPTAMTPSTHHVTIQSPYTPESPGRPHRKPNQTPIPKRKTDLTRAARLERSPSTQLIPASGRAGPQVDEGDVDEDANIRIGILGEDDDDEYEPLPDIPDAPGDSHDEAKYGEIALVERTRLPVKPAYYPPAPWTPSSHRPSPEPVLESPHTWERKGWYRNRSSSPLTFSRSVSPLERLVTPPFEPDTTLLDPTIGRGNRNQAEKHGRKNGKRCKGAWKGEAVLRRMEEGDRAEAEFWLWIGGQEGIDGSKRNRAKKRGAEDDDATDMESDGGLHDTDGAELVGADGGEKTARQPRRKTKRAQLLDVLYDTEASRQAMDRRIRHYEALADEYELRFETVW